MRQINTLVIHHSASKSGTIAQFRAEHIARGFGDIGYHYVIGNGDGIANGLICGGRNPEFVGCGVFGNNTGKLHICLVGNFHKPDDGFTGSPADAQLRSLGAWLLVNADKYGPKIGKPLPHIVGHKEITVPGHGTACPGSEMNLHAIRVWFEAAYHRWKAGEPYNHLDTFITATRTGK